MNLALGNLLQLLTLGGNYQQLPLVFACMFILLLRLFEHKISLN